MRHILAVFLLLTLTACSLFSPLPTGIEPTVQIPAADLYRQAKTELDDGNFHDAIKLYESLQSRYPYGRYAQQSLLEMAYAYYRTGEPDPAIAAANRFIKQFPNNAHVDYAYYVKGLANFNGERSVLSSVAGQDPTERDPLSLQDAFDAFNDLVTRYPNSKYAQDSRVRMKYLSNALARHELHIASYYLRRGAYIAATKRAQDILILYPNSPSTREALEIMVQSYDAMGMPQLRDDARRVLASNPNTAKTQDNVLASKSWWRFWQ